MEVFSHFFFVCLFVSSHSFSLAIGEKERERERKREKEREREHVHNINYIPLVEWTQQKWFYLKQSFEAMEVN